MFSYDEAIGEQMNGIYFLNTLTMTFKVKILVLRKMIKVLVILFIIKLYA